MENEWIETNGQRPDLPDEMLLADVLYQDDHLWSKTGWEPIRVCQVLWGVTKGYKLATPAKAEREPRCTRSHPHENMSEACPRWVRCDDRLPGDGREYRGRSDGRPGYWIRVRDGQVQCRDTRPWFVAPFPIHLEWLDEAPAREGQINAAPSDVRLEPKEAHAPLLADSSPVTGYDGPSGAAPDSHGYRGRAIEQRDAEKARVKGIRDFVSVFGGCRGRVG